MAIEPLDSLTQICLARQLSPETWLRLYKEAATKNAESKDAPPLNIHIQAIDHVLPLMRSSQAPLTQSYLQACLVADGPKKELLKKLLESIPHQAGASELDIWNHGYLESLAAALLASDPALVSKVQPEKSMQEAYRRLQAVMRLLSTAARAQLSSLFVLSLQLLQLPLGHESKEPPEDSLKRFISEDIASCRNALSSMTDTLASLPYPVEMAHKQLNKLERLLDPIANRKRTFARPASFPSIPLELEILLQSVLYDNCVGAVSALRGSVAARIAVQRAISDSPDAIDRQDLLRHWLGDLFQCCSDHTSLLDEPKDRLEAKWRAFTFGRLPGLLAELRNDPSLSELGSDWPTAIDEGLQICLERRKEKGTGDLTRWTNGVKEYLQTSQDMKAEITDGSAADIIGLLQDGLHEYSSQASAATAMASELSKWTSNSDFPALQHFLLSLVKETPRIVDYVLLHHAAESLFKPICQLLDSWDSPDEYGAGQAMEIYGGILLALRTLVRRHTLQDTFSRFGLRITSAITASSAALSKPTSLRALSDEHRKLVSAWITALYGSEGIEDDLIRSTPPQTMLMLAPTIVHQSMIAMENGIIDQETLLSGLSYFCQDFLTFALPSIITYLATRPRPNLQVIAPLLASDSTPACVIELVQDDLRQALKNMDSAKEDVKELSKSLKHVSTASPLNISTLGIALATGTDVVQNLRASFERQSPDSMISVLARRQDPLMASLEISQAGLPRVLDSLRVLLMLAARGVRAADEEQAQREMDILADLTALVTIRTGIRPEQEEVSRCTQSYRDRLETWLVE